MKKLILKIIALTIVLSAFITIEGCKKIETEAQSWFYKPLQSHLMFIKNEVASIYDSSSGQQLNIPDFDQIYHAASQVESVADPAKRIASIYTLLGRAADVDCKVPNPANALTFPADHHMNADYGFEWYYLGIHLDAISPQGDTGRIGIVLSMQKQRIIGLTTQLEYELSDMECMLLINLATATIDFPDGKKIIRRGDNLQLPALGGSGGFSSPGDDFYFNCGSDMLSGGLHVLPLKTEVRDGQNLNFSLNFIPPDEIETESAYFLQGIPNPATLSGTGFTDNPTPGIYYSWPQLQVDMSLNNTITIDNQTYTIIHGSGWMDHQLMMTSLKNAGDATHPVPFVEEPTPYNGWSWQFFNLQNGSSITGASFQLGDIKTNIPLTYGYFVYPDTAHAKWNSLFIVGEMMLKEMQYHPAIIGDENSPLVSIPSLWEYPIIQSVGLTLSGVATPWFDDGTFNGQSYQIISENPVDYFDTSGEHFNGLGFCESIGFERVDSYRKRLLEYLK